MSQWASQTRKLNRHYQNGSGGGTVDHVNAQWMWFNFNYFGDNAKVYFPDAIVPPPPSLDGRALSVGTSLLSGGESLIRIKGNARTFYSPVRDRPVYIEYVPNNGYPADPTTGQLRPENVNVSLSGSNKIPIGMITDSQGNVYDQPTYQNNSYQFNYRGLEKWLKRSRFSYYGTTKSLYDCLYTNISSPQTFYGRFMDAVSTLAYSNGNYIYLKQDVTGSGTYFDKSTQDPIDDDTYIVIHVNAQITTNGEIVI